MNRLAVAAIGWELADLGSFVAMVRIAGPEHEMNGVVSGLFASDPGLVVGAKVAIVLLLVGFAVALDTGYAGWDWLPGPLARGVLGWRTKIAMLAALAAAAFVGLYGTLTNVAEIAQNILTLG